MGEEAGGERIKTSMGVWLDLCVQGGDGVVGETPDCGGLTAVYRATALRYL